MATGEISFDFKVDMDLDALKSSFQKAILAAQQVVASALLADATSYVPVLTGALKDSGRIESFPTFDDALIFTRVVYGDDQIPYARYQHEENLNHPQLGFKGRAKYLLRPWNANGAFYMALFELEVASRLEDPDFGSEVLSNLGIAVPS